MSDPRFAALFQPRGVVVAGASSHPGKFGFTALHNILAGGYEGEVFAVNREGEEILGRPTFRSVDDIPAGAADLVFVCTPASANPGVLRACAAKGITAAFVASAGYREAGEEGLQAEQDLAALADELGILLAGPNGQGVISTPAQLCAQIVAPYPPAGGISIASQSGNFVSSLLNYSVSSGVGVARAVSVGNAATLGVADYLSYYGEDEATAVALTYVEGVGDGRRFLADMAAVSSRKPVVLVKGGVTEGGARAAASHTGSLASEDRVFDGAVRQAGIRRCGSIEEAFDVAASFATQPLPVGPNTVVVTTVGGWGVVTADAIGASGLRLLPLPDDLRAGIDRLLPPRWSRNNPIDMAGGETRDTVPEILRLVAGHPDVHAVLFLGLGIQSNTARMLRGGPFFPDHGLERIVSFHERQDHRFAMTAAEVSEETGKPILVATELAATQPDNPGPAAVRESGRYCYPSAQRAVTALDHMWGYQRWRQRRGLA
ncbi:MAG TPA: CoA-binding protein [Acidimicrobiales bacterium]|nr:CoA-binding protein [Acidimicrobiales bacterium]